MSQLVASFFNSPLLSRVGSVSIIADYQKIRTIKDAGCRQLQMSLVLDSVHQHLFIFFRER